MSQKVDYHLNWVCCPEEKVSPDEVDDPMSKKVLAEYNASLQEATSPTEFRNITQEINKVIERIVEKINELQKGANFSLSAVYALGSAADGTMVRRLGEFDLLLEVRLDNRVQMHVDQNNPGHVRLLLTEEVQTGECKLTEDSNDWLFKPYDFLLCTEKLNYWMKSTFDKVIEILSGEEDNVALKIFRTKGPSCCLELALPESISASPVRLNFVPGIQLLGLDKRLHAVPKSLPNWKQDATHYWRISFCVVERSFLDFVCQGQHKDMKLALLIIYRLAKASQLKEVAAVPPYIFKTALFHFASAVDRNWSLENIGPVFVEYLEYLELRFRREYLQHYFLSPSNIRVCEAVGIQTVRNVCMDVMKVDVCDTGLRNVRELAARMRQEQETETE